MGLKNIFKMTKTDRYTQDGRDELAKLQETEDVTYKTGDISQKTGLQKQPDGSWAPPKKGAGNKPTEERKINETINAKRAQQKEAEKAEYNRNIRSFYDNTGLKGGPEEVLARKEAEKADRKQENLQPGKRDDSMFKEKDKVEFARHGKYMNGEIESIRKDWKGNVSMFVKGEDGQSYFVEAGDITKHKPSGESKPAEKDIRSEFNITREEHDMDARESNAKIYPELQPLVKQRKVFFQKQVEAYGKLRDNPNNPKARADFVDAKNAISQIDADIDRAYKKATSEEAPGSAESKAWADRSKNERTATLVDWLDDWDKHPEEKNDAAYAAIEKELASRGVNRAGRQDAKKADNAGRNEFYRRAYEGDAAPRELTGDCKIRIRK